jgi:selT/selW/selH-like putative selenoprotein
LAATIQAKMGAAKGATNVETQLVKGARGSFEVFKDDVLIFSKLSTGQFPVSEDAVVELL